MSADRVVFTKTGVSDFRLRSIGEGDLEDLRTWKNRNSEFFFLKTDITPEQQSNWYLQFLQRADDHMFIAEEYLHNTWQKAGCMGFRLLPEEDTVDAYNIMRFQKKAEMVQSMAVMFTTMLRYASDQHPGFSLSVKVLKTNPAIEWYTARIGFKLTAEKDTWNYYELDRSSIAGIMLTYL